jgi:hypothetical protein
VLLEQQDNKDQPVQLVVLDQQVHQAQLVLPDQPVLLELQAM